jgi:phospholipase D1/2
MSTAPQDQRALLARFKQVKIVLDPTGTTKTQSTSAPGWFPAIEPLFAPQRTGNDVKAYSTGVDFYTDVAEAFEQAREHIWIAGWQVAWDVELKDFGKGTSRLIDLLAKAVHKKLDVRVMLFKAPFGKPPIDDEKVAQVLRSIGAKAIRTEGQSAYAEKVYSYFAHHQKTIIVDRKTAFVGGMDLSHGRRDDGDFVARADPAERRMNEMYNNCVPHTRKLDKNQLAIEKADPKSPGAARGIYDGSPGLLDYTQRPRQPWQDVHLRIVGPSAFDVACNFIRRWNGLVDTDDDIKIFDTSSVYYDQGFGAQPPKVTPADYYITRAGTTPLSAYTAESLPRTGRMTVQILRSASAKEIAAEYKPSCTPPNLLGEMTDAERAAKARKLPAGAEINIQEAMVRAILGAQFFVYIENQYFVSHHGTPQAVDDGGNVRPMAQVPTSPEMAHAWSDMSTAAALALRSGTNEAHDVYNELVPALGQRLRAAILAGQPFHVYLMTPLHSEGLMGDPINMSVMHLTMQTLTFGSQSLINLVKHAILEKALGSEGIAKLSPEELQGQLWNMPESSWQKYLTLLYGRTYDLLPGAHLVTEQVYVHSKCLIADDRIAIVGSANINDRSLMGDRDTEIAALVLDPATESEVIDGKHPQQVRKFAKDLRVALWKKHLGLSKKKTLVGPPAASDLSSVLDKPAAPATIAAIQKQAKANSAVYENAFDWIPRNKDLRRRDSQGKSIPSMGSSVWPGWHKDAPKDSFQPWSSKFVYPRDMIAETTRDDLTDGIKGYWCAYPHLWMQGQNNLSSHISLELLSRVEPAPEPIDAADEGQHA